MQCDICQRTSTSRLPFNCTTCARNALYALRVKHAQILLEGEALGEEVEKNVTSRQTRESQSGEQDWLHEAHPTHAIERLAAERVVMEEKTATVVARVDTLRKQLEEMKTYISKKKLELYERRSNLEVATKRMNKGPKQDLDPFEKDIRRTQSRWESLHSKTAEARAFLCREAAHLYGLQQRKRKKGMPGRDLYLIGGAPICDLRDLNNASPSHVSTSTTNLAHLTHLVSHYLGLRLPAEITLPHRDYPLPTIFSPGSSYTYREVPYPGLTLSHSSNNSPSASRTADTSPLPRPRPLHLDKKLIILAKDEPLIYASFIEGITLLAWDIAWMCKTQGLDVGKGSWEEVCATGKNLWQLLLGPPLPLRRHPSAKDLLNPAIARNGENVQPSIPSALGNFSHNTAHSFLSASEGVDYMNGWRLQSPIKVIDRVKAMLLSERDGAEWQILEENEWEEGNEAIEPGKDDQNIERTVEETVLIEGIPKHISETELRNRQVIEDPLRAEDDAEKTKGTSGWTKLKSRGAL